MAGQGAAGYSGKQFRPTAGPSGSGFCAHPCRLSPEDEAFHYNNRLRAHGGGAGTTLAGTPVPQVPLGAPCWAGAGVGEGRLSEEGAAERPGSQELGLLLLSSRSHDSRGVTHEVPGGTAREAALGLAEEECSHN